MAGHWSKQCWITINWFPRNKFHWNLNRFVEGDAMKMFLANVSVCSGLKVSIHFLAYQILVPLQTLALIFSWKKASGFVGGCGFLLPISSDLDNGLPPTRCLGLDDDTSVPSPNPNHLTYSRLDMVYMIIYIVLVKCWYDICTGFESRLLKGQCVQRWLSREHTTYQ